MKTRTMLVIICLIFSILSPVAITAPASGDSTGLFLATIDVCHAQGTGLSADSDSPFIIPDAIPVQSPASSETGFMTADTFYRLLTSFELDRPPDFSSRLS